MAEDKPGDGPAYLSQVEVVRDRGAHRRAWLPGGEEIAFGVHGAVAAHYGVDPDTVDPDSTTLDYVVAAAAG